MHFMVLTVVQAVSYSWSSTKGGSLTLGGGDHNLNFQRLHNAWTGNYDAMIGLGVLKLKLQDLKVMEQYHLEIGIDRSSAKSTFGERMQTDIFGGYQSKFFGWPEMYAAPYGSNETEYIKTRLFMINHLQNYGEKVGKQRIS